MAVVDKLLKYFPVTFSDMVEYGGYIWFASINSNGLYRVNYESGEMEYLGKFPIREERFLFDLVACYKSRLYFLPGSSEKIVEFDTVSRQFTGFVVPDDYKQIGFYGVGQYQQFLFFWNYKNYDVIRFDTESKEFKILKSSVYMAQSADDMHEFVMLWRGHCTVGTHLYIPSPERPIVLEVDMEESTVQMHKVPGLEGYRTICYDGKRFWLSGSENCLVAWNLDADKTEMYPVNSDIPICDVVFGVNEQSTIYYSLKNKNEIIMLYTDQMKFDIIPDCRDDYNYLTTGIHPFDILLKKGQNKVWILNCKDGTLQVLKKGKRSIYETKLVYGTEDFIQDRIEYFFSDYLREEKKDGFGIEEYLEYMSGSGNLHNCGKIQPGASGSQIYEVINEVQNK